MPKLNMDSGFEKQAVLLEDTYSAVLKEVNEYTKDYGEGPVEKLAWSFEVTCSEEDIDDEVEYEAKFGGSIEVAAHTSYATGQNSNFTKFGLAKFAGAEWDGDTDSLVGRSALLDLVQFKGQMGDTRNGVDKVKPPKKTKKSKAEQAQAENGAEMEEIPF